MNMASEASDGESVLGLSWMQMIEFEEEFLLESEEMRMAVMRELQGM